MDHLVYVKDVDPYAMTGKKRLGQVKISFISQ